jgi:hypothetical protein
VAVRAKHSKVLEPIVVLDAVDVVDVDAKRLSTPLAQPTFGASIFE